MICICGGQGKSKCGRCLEISYCGVECQTKDWPVHKPACNKSCKINDTVNRIFNLIKGNLMVMHAWYDCQLRVVINESIDDIVNGESMYFITMAAANDVTNDVTNDISNDNSNDVTNDNTNNIAATNIVLIDFIFTDYSCTRELKLTLPEDKIREMQKKPSIEWTIAL
jgi:hypothetical protein